MAHKRTASAVWSGNLKQGKGTLSTGSGAIKSTPYSFSMRFENAPGTNPEELIAAAEAGCYAMALSADLGEAGFTPDQISAQGTVTFDMPGGKPTLTGLHLVVTAKVPKIDAKKFQEVATATKAGCPISRALSIPITLDAKLE
ncbi:MAG: OsmC family peroxiredoxin [Alphaproteobacteria bacterium]|nr:OsmC family peroxiredoxin [Alphaproteobacteria bacterium]